MIHLMFTLNLQSQFLDMAKMFSWSSSILFLFGYFILILSMYYFKKRKH
jgi:uncharacterized membrane protein (DUF485 family)